MLQGGTPTDRLLAEWNLGSERVSAARLGTLAAAADPAMRIALPGELTEWRRAGLVAPLEGVQRTLRHSLSDAFAQGLVLSGFVRDTAGGGAYLLEEASLLDRALHNENRIPE